VEILLELFVYGTFAAVAVGVYYFQRTMHAGFSQPNTQLNRFSYDLAFPSNKWDVVGEQSFPLVLEREGVSCSIHEIPDEERYRMRFVCSLPKACSDSFALLPKWEAGILPEEWEAMFSSLDVADAIALPASSFDDRYQMWGTLHDYFRIAGHAAEFHHHWSDHAFQGLNETELRVEMTRESSEDRTLLKGLPIGFVPEAYGSFANLECFAIYEKKLYIQANERHPAHVMPLAEVYIERVLAFLGGWIKDDGAFRLSKQVNRLISQERELFGGGGEETKVSVYAERMCKHYASNEPKYLAAIIGELLVSQEDDLIELAFSYAGAESEQALVRFASSVQHSNKLRLQALDVLEKEGSLVDHRKALLNMATHTQNVETMQMAALRKWAQSYESEPVSQLFSLLENANAVEIHGLFLALSMFGSREDEQQLLSYLAANEPGTKERCAAIDTLVAIGGRDAMVLLQEWQDSSDKVLAKAARKAIPVLRERLALDVGEGGGLSLSTNDVGGELGFVEEPE
jgi:hypothetical protein